MQTTNKFIPYAHQFITEQDIKAVSDVLRGDWLTTGPTIERFEDAFAERHGARYAVAMSSCTAALHAAVDYIAKYYSAGEISVPAITFAATANAVQYIDILPVFCDVNKDTMIGKYRDSASIIVEYAGLEQTCYTFGHPVIFDKAHGCGNRHSGTISCYSFHPVKHITTGEGGMLTTNDVAVAVFARRFRNHGMQNGDMINLGYNYRMTDIQAALGLSQLATLDERIRRRREIAARYNDTIGRLPQIEVMPYPVGASVWHLYPIRLYMDKLTIGRYNFREILKLRGIGTQVHYRPVYYHPYYQRLGYKHGLCPVAEAEYERLVSLPMWYGMTDEDVEKVIQVVTDVCNEFSA